MRVFFFCVILSLLLSSCNKKAGEVKMTLEIYDISEKDNGPYSGQVANVVCRILDRTASEIDLKVTNEESRINLSFSYFEKDSSKLYRIKRALNAGRSRFEFWETYSNADMISYWEQINTNIRRHFGDSMLLQLLSRNKNNIDLSESAQKNHDSTLCIYPINAFLIPNISQRRNLVDGPIIGFALSKDTAAVNKFLSIEELKPLARKMIFRWSAKPSPSYPEKKIFELYCLKQNGKDPLLTSGDIQQARIDKDSNGNPCVSFVFSSEAAIKWEKLTKKLSEGMNNYKKDPKAVAMVFDDMVLSAPTVISPIPNGNSQVTGSFTMAECEDLVAKIRTPLNFSSRIISYEVIRSEK